MNKSPTLHFVFGASLLVTLPLMITSCSDEPGANNGPKQIVTAGFRADRTHLIVENKDATDWTEKTIYINGTPPDAYRCDIVPLKHGERMKLPLSEFTKRDGERFDGRRFAVKIVWIGGGGCDYASYGF